MRFDQEQLSQKNFANEMEIMKDKLERNFKEEFARQENIHEAKVQELQAEIDSLNSELGKNSLLNGQLRAKIAKQEEMLTDAHKYLKQIQGIGILESQVEDLKEKCSLMRLKKEEMKITLSDVHSENERLLFDKQNLLEKNHLLIEELDKTMNKGKIWFDALQVSSIANQDV